MSSPEDYGPAIDYILANRQKHPRTKIDAELLTRGYDPAVIDEFWIGIQKGEAQIQKRSGRRILWAWNLGVWGIGVALAMYAGWSNCRNVVDPVAHEVCTSTSGQDVTGMTLGLAVLPIWLIGFLVIRLLMRLTGRGGP